MVENFVGQRLTTEILSGWTRRGFLLQLAAAGGAAAASTERLASGDSTIDVSIADGELDVTREALIAWVRRAVDAVHDFYGVFPVREAKIQIRPVEGRKSVFNGVTFGRSPATMTRISVGQHASEAELLKDWVMTHELVHLAFPSVPRENHWIEEGIATYVEPLARLHLKQITEDTFWGEMIRDMPQGLPKEGDQGMDHTHTWGRTYWGGGLFCLAAEVEIRERTSNRKGLRDALCAILTGIGNIQTDADSLPAVLAAGDPVLGDMYNRWKDAPVPVDLTALWKKLGVSQRNKGSGIVYDKSGAAMRKAITQPMPPPSTTPRG